MTSKPGASECFVYIMLPGTNSFVTAGRFVLEPDRTGVPVGRFVYGKSYLDNPDAVPIDPIELKLTGTTYQTTALKGVFGALRDAGPDYWGRRVIEKHAGLPQLGEIDYLLYAPDDRAGALGFGLGAKPPAPQRKFNKTVGLEKLIGLADAIIDGEDVPDGPEAGQVEDLMLIGTSMGGARPKAVVEDDEGLWIAKFNRPDDKWNYARVEHAMLELARACGLQTAQSRIVSVGDRDVLLVKRFDRERTDQGYLRARMMSGLTILRTEDTHQHRDRWSYVLLAEELRRLSAQPKDDARELFTRMVFNALISNTDDHPRNHAAIAREKDWRLSPAYDLTPSMPISEERRDLAMTCGDYGRYANAENMLSQAARFHLTPDEATVIIDGMEEQIKATWYETARREGVPEAHCEAISTAFAYPGFRLKPQES
ncbi:type II toxin-antitoxin system HipA family toxin [Yoonia sediminilitoris]|uniref:Serine/threonine-protein kinase HipA n=1 Tax=Yoonia sediminilitoris TaxID=1286148 RepID=A0A2T6KAZ2_9RHOB|nr:HipA domain-containing protein [Yoonia sediminilitoris]PUB12028.1 serine/threonine-protein kinase HipA [Yoonia sediminilitoris]RCW92855.1 serine/threonine-protein kinase HipA [Yoonia sediminilitoris]